MIDWNAVRPYSRLRPRSCTRTDHASRPLAISTLTPPTLTSGLAIHHGCDGDLLRAVHDDERRRQRLRSDARHAGRGLRPDQPEGGPPPLPRPRIVATHSLPEMDGVGRTAREPTERQRLCAEGWQTPKSDLTAAGLLRDGNRRRVGRPDRDGTLRKDLPEGTALCARRLCPPRYSCHTWPSRH